MKVLHLPVNFASYIYHTVKGLKEIGVDARGLVFNNSPLSSSEGLINVEIPSGKELFHYLFGKMQRTYYFLKLAKWADVIHWYFGTPALSSRFGRIDLKYLKFLKKPAVVEWLGSDIRIPEVEAKDNPYFLSVLNDYQARTGVSFEKSYRLQSLFAKAGFACIVSIDMQQYLFPNLWRKVYIVFQRIFLPEYKPLYPDPSARRPIVVHSPSNPVIKGTSAVIKAVELLKEKYDFQFILVKNTPHREALQIMQRADIFVDQFVLGAYAMASLEAMAFGKPVICYIKPSLLEKYPPDLPIVNANQDNLADALEELLKDGKLRYEIGKRSRQYVEKYHDAVKLAKQLVHIYKEIGV